jgi:hypothetical protein
MGMSISSDRQLDALDAFLELYATAEKLKDDIAAWKKAKSEAMKAAGQLATAKDIGRLHAEAVEDRKLAEDQLAAAMVRIDKETKAASDALAKREKAFDDRRRQEERDYDQRLKQVTEREKAAGQLEDAAAKLTAKAEKDAAEAVRQRNEAAELRRTLDDKLKAVQKAVA